MNNLKDIHNVFSSCGVTSALFYQDFNEQFEGYTQPWIPTPSRLIGCFIRISMNNLKDIHNPGSVGFQFPCVVLSGFQ